MTDAAVDPWHARDQPGDDRLGGPAFGRLVAAFRLLQDRLSAANLPEDLVPELADRLEGIAAELVRFEVPEKEQPAGRRDDLPGRGSFLLLPSYWDERTERSARGHVVFSRSHLGGNGAAHGGTVPLLFDEVLGKLANAGGRPTARTAYLTVNYRHITPVGRELVFEASFDREEGRKRWLSGRLYDGAMLVADAEGLFVRLLPGQP